MAATAKFESSGPYWLRLAAQIAVVALCSTALGWVASANGIRTPLNLIWMLGIPIGAALAFNRRTEAKIGMGFINTVIALFSPELLAHSVGYCLY